MQPEPGAIKLLTQTMEVYIVQVQVLVQVFIDILAA